MHGPNMSLTYLSFTQGNMGYSHNSHSTQENLGQWFPILPIRKLYQTSNFIVKLQKRGIIMRKHLITWIKSYSYLPKGDQGHDKFGEVTDHLFEQLFFIGRQLFVRVEDSKLDDYLNYTFYQLFRFNLWLCILRCVIYIKILLKAKT